MTSVALLCRSNCCLLSALNAWRKVTIGTGAITHRHYSNSINSSSRSRSRSSAWPQRQLVKHVARAYQSSKSMDSPPDVFRGVTDRFLGVTVDCKDLKIANKSQFCEKLHKSLDFWRANKNRAIWFRVYKEQAEWVPILAGAGFDFHHARTGVVTMYRWLPTHEQSNLPSYAHTLLGVGGLVINDQNEVLVVSDKYAIAKNMWKLPGGYVEPRENLVDSAVREVVEETGIRTTFRSMVCLRHSHGGNFDCSDIYVVIGLKPLNLDLKRCEREIARVCWMPMDEYMRNPQVLEASRLFVRTYLDYQKRGLDFTCTNMTHQVLKKEYQLYYVDQAKDDKEVPTK
ncbi:nudix hydrolase 8 isoform X2 [Drosophila novamexicana]|nr:nudix hydrolase 8 isoform X2 [Drosophila novamexicana]